MIATSSFLHFTIIIKPFPKPSTLVLIFKHLLLLHLPKISFIILMSCCKLRLISHFRPILLIIGSNQHINMLWINVVIDVDSVYISLVFFISESFYLISQRLKTSTFKWIKRCLTPIFFFFLLHLNITLYLVTNFLFISCNIHFCISINISVVVFFV